MGIPWRAGDSLILIAHRLRCNHGTYKLGQRQGAKADGRADRVHLAEVRLRHRIHTKAAAGAARLDGEPQAPTQEAAREGLF